MFRYIYISQPWGVIASIAEKEMQNTLCNDCGSENALSHLKCSTKGLRKILIGCLKFHFIKIAFSPVNVLKVLLACLIKDYTMAEIRVISVARH